MRIDRLFAMARSEPAQEPPPGFASRVIRALPDRALSNAPTPSLWDQLNALFPRLALVSALVMALCLGLELFGSGWGQSDLTSDLALLSDQWLFPTKGF